MKIWCIVIVKKNLNIILYYSEDCKNYRKKRFRDVVVKIWGNSFLDIFLRIYIYLIYFVKYVDVIFCWGYGGSIIILKEMNVFIVIYF